ncbi:MAG: hypothetical protein J6L81_10035 [Clostridia bacterium]|nr:hypothetical protein [Clostridia bacterium]
MNIIVISAIAVIACVLILTIKKWQPDIAFVISVVTGAIITIYIIMSFVPYISALSDMLNISGVGTYFGVLIKVIGICAVAGIASDVCRDAGQTSIASRVDIAGRLCIIAVSMPLFIELFEQAAEIIGG